ncbi:MAG: glycosyltransferase family 2 protein [Acidobacteriota bacterium]
MIFVYYSFAVLLIYFSYKSFRGGFEYLNFFRQELAKPRSDFTPFCSIIAPCKGLDHDLEKNLQALFEQDFPNYEIVFVVDSETDEALSVIKNIHRRDAETQRISKIVISGKAENEAQKVHNLREAILHVADESEVFVFVDSDARPNKDWLRNLIAPLQDEKIGCASGYRWFISKSFSLATEMRSVWNASIASALGANIKGNFCWGGSMAIRREIFEKLNMHEKWRGVLSDDFAMTRSMNEAN